jgi:hypothetical protein
VFTALLVTSAATLFESAPFVLAALVLTRTPARWSARIDGYLGCGCGAGPSARSLPAAAAACLVFGPLVAGARLAAAIAVERLLTRKRECTHARGSLLSELHLVLTPSIAGAFAVLFLPAVLQVHASRPASFALGALAAFTMAPCALGGVGLAASLRTVLPAASAGFLCVAGIVDARTWLRRGETGAAHDTLAYAMLALACALVAARSGAALLNPRFTFALWLCAVTAACAAYRFRDRRCARLRVAPSIMLAGALLAAPMPQYHATETSLGGAFAGERLDFTGVLTQTGEAATLVRYAITCCRADAAPIVVRLAQAPPPAMHGWIHARGVLVARGHELRLRVDRFTPIAPPADPFVYR